jgi:anti-sigma regulatory factor (Ser/Thr protein kinase)
LEAKYQKEDIDEICNKYVAKTYVPIFCLPIENNNEREKDIVAIREALLALLSKVITTQINADAKFKRPLLYFLAELTDNMVEHSLSKNGIIVAQSFINAGFIDISMVDFGIGLRKS